MPVITVNVSEEELKALEWEIADIQVWLENAILNRARQAVDKAIEEKTDRQARKISRAEKLQLIKNTPLDKAINRPIPE